MTQARGPADPHPGCAPGPTGTWALWTPPSDSPLVGTYVGAKVWQKIVAP